MRLSIAAILALGFAESATAFTPSSFARAPTRSTKLFFDEKPDKTAEAPAAEAEAPVDPNPPNYPGAVFPGVEFPAGEVPWPVPADGGQDPAVDAKVSSFQLPAAGANVPTQDQLKDKVDFKAAQQLLIETQNLKRGIPDPDNYSFFGDDDHAANLIKFVKTNPFFASALTETDNGFILESFDPSDPQAECSPSLYRKMMSALGGTGHRVNVHFNKKLTKIRRIEVYDELTDELSDKIRPKEDEEIREWAASAMYNLIYFSSCIHGTIHILHYLVTGALNSGSEGFDEMNQWAQFYATNIQRKYQEVHGALLRPPAPAMAVLNPAFAAAATANAYALVSGTMGFGARSGEIMPMCQDMLEMWFENPTTWVESMIKISPEKMDEVGMLTEFRKQIAFVKPFASEMSEALSSIDSEKFAAAESKTADLLGNVGLKSNIKTIADWTEVMCVTGIVHGSTISYTRAFSNAEILAWRNKQNPVWDAGDIRIVTIGLTTVTGMQDERHVFSPATNEGGLSYAKPIADVLEKYTAMSDERKEAYMKELLKDMDEFNKYGWILSDWCPTGFDGKQLTIATYI